MKSKQNRAKILVGKIEGKSQNKNMKKLFSILKEAKNKKKKTAKFFVLKMNLEI